MFVASFSFSFSHRFLKINKNYCCYTSTQLKSIPRLWSDLFQNLIRQIVILLDKVKIK